MRAKVSRFLEWAAEMWKAIFIGVVFGTLFGIYLTEQKLFNDCRIAGAVRIGSAAFKCEQYSRVILMENRNDERKTETSKR